MNRYFMFILGIILCAHVGAQNYSDNVTLVQDNGGNVIVVSTGVGEKKKDASDHAVRSAFNCFLHTGVQGVKNGVAMLAVEDKSFDFRFFQEGRYLNYVMGEVETTDTEKSAGRIRATVQVTINLNGLKGELKRTGLALNPGWSDAKAANATSALNPTIVIVPYLKADEGSSFDVMRKKVEETGYYRTAIDRVAQEFQRHGYKTRDFISQLQNTRLSSMMGDGTQTDEATLIIQRLPGDIVVQVEVNMNSVGGKSECALSVRAVEKQTAGQLATSIFNSGQYMTTDYNQLVDHSVKKMQADFFKQLQNAFEDMIKKGHEVVAELKLSESIDGWDFDQDAPATGEFFKDALDEWLREHSFQGIYDMSNNTDRYIAIRLNIPLWNAERNRSYTLSNFGSDMRKFFRAQMGDEYKVSVKALGQRLHVTIE